MEMETLIQPLDIFEAVLGRSLLATITLFFLLIATWGCMAVVIEAQKDLERRSGK